MASIQDKELLELSRLKRIDLMRLALEVSRHPEIVSGLTIDEQVELSATTVGEWDQLLHELSRLGR